MKIILKLLLGLILGILLLILLWMQWRTVLSLDEDRSVTVWKTLGGKCYVVLGHYYGVTKPTDGYIELDNGTYGMDVIWDKKNNKIMCCSDGSMRIVQITDPASPRIVDCTSDEERFHSSYTDFDGRYHRYHESTERISFNIKEGVERTD